MDSQESLAAESQLSGYLTVTEVAEVLRVKPATVYDLCRSGDLPAFQPLKAWLVKASDLEAYIASHSNQAAAS